jgi:cullin-associated NEDD8-dissociated protein 1
MFCSRQAGHRFGEHIERVMPLIVRYSREEDDELREYCLQAFEAFVHRCPKEITPHIHTVRYWSCNLFCSQKIFL